MKYCAFILLFISLFANAQTKRKVVKYRTHTDLDFSEQMVQGKIRSPDVFYIFQRKRSAGPKIVEAPLLLNEQRQQTRRLAEDVL